MKTIKSLYKQYGHIFPFLAYLLIYLGWFTWVEKNVTKNYTVIHVALDDYIPFCEIFIVPYLLWFLYQTVVVVYLWLKNKSDFTRMCIFLCTGMTLFLIVSTFFPNGHHLRLETMPRDNIFTQMIAVLWKTDTATNILPSIHVYNSIGIHFAVMRSADLENKKGIQIASLILSVSIVLSTMFIKQHSVLDVVTAIALCGIMYVAVYRREAVLAAREQQKSKKTPLVE